MVAIRGYGSIRGFGMTVFILYERRLSELPVFEGLGFNLELWVYEFGVRV